MVWWHTPLCFWVPHRHPGSVSGMFFQGGCCSNVVVYEGPALWCPYCINGWVASSKPVNKIKCLFYHPLLLASNWIQLDRSLRQSVSLSMPLHTRVCFYSIVDLCRTFILLSSDEIHIMQHMWATENRSKTVWRGGQVLSKMSRRQAILPCCPISNKLAIESYRYIQNWWTLSSCAKAAVLPKNICMIIFSFVPLTLSSPQ